MKDKDHHFLQVDSYEEVMRRGINKIGHEVYAAQRNGGGTMINLVSDADDTAEQSHFIATLQTSLGIQPRDVDHIDIETIINAVELGVKRYKLGIPEEQMEQQTLAQNVFQYVYRSFGEDRKGWRIGSTAIMDRMEEIARADQTNLGTFAALFAEANQAPSNDHPRLVVLQYPSLDRYQPFKRAEDADAARLDVRERQRAEDIMRVYLLITQVYPGRFTRRDNPQGNVVVNVVDNSFRFFAARNKPVTYYEFMSSSPLETPTAHAKFR